MNELSDFELISASQSKGHDKRTNIPLSFGFCTESGINDVEVESSPVYLTSGPITKELSNEQLLKDYKPYQNHKHDQPK